MTTLLAHTRPSGPDPDWPTHPPFPPTGPQATYPGQPVPSGPNPNDPPPRPQFVGAVAVAIGQLRAVSPYCADRVSVAGDGCWTWTGNIGTRDGYGAIRQKGPNRGRIAHVVVYELLVGPVADGLQLDHLCHTVSDCVGGKSCLHRRCVNPAHLDPVTPRENSLRSKGLTAQNAVKTCCLRGHPFTPEGTYSQPTGRGCRACKSEESAFRHQVATGFIGPVWPNFHRKRVPTRRLSFAGGAR